MIARQYRGAADLRLMQEALIRGYASTETRIGDVAWRARYHTHYELSLEIRLWFVASNLLAWTWLRTRGGFDTYVVPELRGDEGLWTEMLDSVEATVSARLRAGDGLEDLYTWFTDDDVQMAARLERRGFIRSEEPGGDLLLADLGNLPEAIPEPGYELAWVSGAADIHGRVESHRAAFAPSDLTVPMYLRVRDSWPYRAELDRIVRTPEGEIAACCTAWLDETNRAGLLEPVSTHPAHQNRGLARLVVGDALRALRNAGATVALVGTSGAAARAAYTAAGFRPWKREITVRKRVGGLPAAPCESG
jgi:predicted N-acetyltransferase YhbS